MQLEDWLDDLCVRFIVNLPPEELASVERICFQVEEAQWFYEDFIRPLDPSLPSLSLKSFSLRIFQHCPLFSTWSTQHYTSAFAEFLAYKQRVPVRGAIMLNEDMDEVVLVKGWKKGANWSFPRGKINKDENDLVCAIREVYEETGFDIGAAGLVKPEKDMKYIEVTMREQHMRLYVFRGVPKSTHFEPKTRKEISKIEWYKLTDLPTLKKKHAQHDTQDESHALSANKFYMVAPFLHPLKKWIGQQKKRENRYSSSHLAAPPLTLDESATEGEPGPVSYANYPTNILSPAVPSSLPEVAHVQKQHPPQDPSSHLKQLLKIGTVSQVDPPSIQPASVQNAAAVKSNALLALLRSGSTAEAHPSSHVPAEQAVTTTQVPRASDRTSKLTMANLDVRQVPPSVPSQPSQLPNQQRSLLDLFAGASVQGQKPSTTIPSQAGSSNLPIQGSVQQPLAPYQRTGDPEFARDQPEDDRNELIPSANALPKLTHHTRALLDAFRVAPSPPVQTAKSVPDRNQLSLARDRQTLLDVFKGSSAVAHSKPTAEPKTTVAPPAPNPETSTGASANNIGHHSTQMQSSNASSLLSLFKAREDTVTDSKPQIAKLLQTPAELAAGPTTPKFQQVKLPNELLSVQTRRDAPKKSPQATKAGETAATLEGPVSQPHFEGLAKSPLQTPVDAMRRSPVPTHRTLYDPKQPAPTKILQRSDDAKRSQAKSPRQSKASNAVSSPKQKTRSKPEKPFQPQILKRPQVGDVVKATPSPVLLAAPSVAQTPSSPAVTPVIISRSPAATPSSTSIRKPPSPAADPVIIARSPATTPKILSPPPPAEMMRKGSQQTESQKQNLLSLLTGHTGPVNITKTPQLVSSPGPVSPLTQSQVASPLGEDQPISTRSRMESIPTATSPGVASDSRPRTEKRQTTAGDKAFLLGYLGRIASQGEHGQ